MGGWVRDDIPDLAKRLAIRPRIDRLHELPFETLHILVLVDVELGLGRHLGDDAGLLLDFEVGLVELLLERRGLDLFVKNEHGQDGCAGLG